VKYLQDDGNEVIVGAPSFRNARALSELRNAWTGERTEDVFPESLTFYFEGSGPGGIWPSNNFSYGYAILDGNWADLLFDSTQFRNGLVLNGFQRGRTFNFLIRNSYPVVKF